MSPTEELKSIVARFNREIVENGKMSSFTDFVATDFVNHTAPPGASMGPDGFRAFFVDVLHVAFSSIKVEIHDQIAEGDKVVTRKTIRGIHSGPFIGVSPSAKHVCIRVTDIVRLRNGMYVEHWGNADIYGALAQINSSQTV